MTVFAHYGLWRKINSCGFILLRFFLVRVPDHDFAGARTEKVGDNEPQEFLQMRGLFGPFR